MKFLRIREYYKGNGNKRKEKNIIFKNIKNRRKHRDLPNKNLQKKNITNNI